VLSGIFVLSLKKEGQTKVHSKKTLGLASSFHGHVVFNSFDSLDRSRYFHGPGGSLRGIHEAAQLHDSLESFNMDMEHLMTRTATIV
jgi:hypothetical protein